MYLRTGLWLVVCALAYGAGAGEETSRVRAEIEKLRALVEAGAVSRAQLEREEARLADAMDADLLRATLYGPDLTEDQTAGMIAAAERRWERRKQELAHARRLVEEGAASQLSLGPYLDNLDRARKEYDLAVSRARLCHELTEMARREQELEDAIERIPSGTPSLPGTFTLADLRRLEAAFEIRFSRPLPVSALGDTAVHRAMGFDHRDRVDVAVHPDQPDGVWLREYLEMNRIPYIAFRHAVRGKATGAHIHIGPASNRLVRSVGGFAGGS